VMTFSCPSFLAAAMRPFMPPKAAAEVAVLASTDAVLPDAVLLLAPPVAAAALLLELDELLLQPAASKMDPTAAAVATIALDARKVKPSPCRPWGMGRAWHLG
jgi:hypothetical protein